MSKEVLIQALDLLVEKARKDLEEYHDKRDFGTALLRHASEFINETL